MTIRCLILFSVLFPALLPESVAQARQPNVVLFLIDDMGWTDLACQGSQYFETPHIDRLAAGGMRFTNGYAACAVCSPTRAAIQTGRYPARVGVTDWIRSRFQGGHLPADGKNPTTYVGGPKNKLLCPPNPLWMEHEEATLSEELQAAGYTTCYIGKWHLGMDDWYPDRQGYDLNIGGCDYGQPPSYFDPYFLKRQGDIPTLKPRRAGEYLTDREADEAQKFIRNHADKPFFLMVANYAVHTPIQAKKEITKKYEAKPKTNQKNAKYAAMVESVDDCVGTVLETLDDLNLAGDTLIVFTSDNGGLLGPTHNAPLRSGKGFPWEGGIRVPFIVRWPGTVRPGSESDVPVISMDCLPTILGATGVKRAASSSLDGVDLRPVLTQTGDISRPLYWHFPHYRGRGVTPYSIVRAGDWKLIKWYEGPAFELYNLADDLGESQNVAEREPDRVRALDQQLIAWTKSVGAKLPKPNPGFKP